MTEMDVDMAANIAWCLMGAMMVGVVLMYGCMHKLISQAYEEGRQDSLSRVPIAATAIRHQASPVDQTPMTSPPPKQSVA